MNKKATVGIPLKLKKEFDRLGYQPHFKMRSELGNFLGVWASQRSVYRGPETWNQSAPLPIPTS